MGSSILNRPIVKYGYVAVSLFGLCLGIFSFFKKNSPRIAYTIQSQIPLLNFNIEQPFFHFFVDSLDIASSEENISLFILEVKNTGSNHLRVNDYDDGKFGLILENGVLLGEPEFVSSNTSHIKEKYLDFDNVSTDHFLDIPRISLDKNDFYSISFLVLHNKSDSPILLPTGKIIGQKELLVSPPKETTVWSQLMEGDRKFLVMFIGTFCFIGVMFFLLSLYLIFSKQELRITQREENLMFFDHPNKQHESTT